MDRMAHARLLALALAGLVALGGHVLGGLALW